jgi:hypothetical protein
MVAVVSPEGKSYNVTSVPLTFVLNRKASWMGYSLDGQMNVTITENTTLNGLSNGLHNLTVYARDTFGNVGISETIHFTVTQPAHSSGPFLTLVIAASAITAIGAVAAILIYFRKIKKTKEKVG